VIHDDMMYDPIQGQGHGVRKVVTKFISKSISSANMRALQSKD